MDDMIERASRAMCRLYYTKRSLDPVPPKEVDRLVEQIWESWVDEARAAIEALRNPPEFVLDAMNPSGRYAGTIVVEAWNDAIDAILKEE